jgi:hypothetical protein
MLMLLSCGDGAFRLPLACPRQRIRNFHLNLRDWS